MPSGDPFEGKSDVCVTNTAARHLYYDLVPMGFERRKRASFQQAIQCPQVETVRSKNPSHGGLPIRG
jgi:hypothetical protein